MIVCLMGAPGAGKSTWVLKNKSGFEHIFNTEGVRRNRDMDIGIYMNLQRAKAIRAVEAGQMLIADGTHTIQSHRRVWLTLAERLGLDTKLVVFDTPLNILLEVQKHREFPAPRNVVVDHHRRMQMAKLHVKAEGWGSIETIKR